VEEEPIGRSSEGGTTMSDSTRTARDIHIHIHIPSMGETKEWAEKFLTKENSADAVLLVIATTLCGWIIYHLAAAFQNSTYLM
jgi:hypothetical protein